MDRLLDRLQERSEFELVLRRVAHGARLLGLGWWIALGMVTLFSDGVAAEPGWVVVSIALAGVWAVATSLMYRIDASLGTSRLTVGVDIVLAVFAVLASRFLAVSTVGIYGGFPILVVVIAAIRSPLAAWIAAATLSVTTAGQLIVQAISEGDFAQPVSQIFVYVAGAFIVTWAVTTLRRSDRAILAAREELARTQERSRISAHLHDSVLQTLALIQRAAERPSDVVALARRQERELRGWLYGEEGAGEEGLGDSLRRTAGDVEERYGVPIDVVAVGDSLDQRVVTPLVAAARESMVNASKHSGTDSVSVYAEVTETMAVLYVRDRGNGFDPKSIPTDRRGISDSIEKRLEAIGGTAILRTSPERGTEWKLEAPL